MWRRGAGVDYGLDTGGAGDGLDDEPKPLAAQAPAAMIEEERRFVGVLRQAWPPLIKIEAEDGGNVLVKP